MRLAKSTNPMHQRDTIESWLDVLVTMLKLPSAHRDQIRDELEDHLRSRVDDLLIMGKSEPDAIQTAIHELGETAELAKLISTASHTRTPFRRFAMNATFFVLAGSILTASVSMMMPTSTIPTHTIIEAPLEAAQLPAPTRQKFSIEKSNTDRVLEQIADAFGLTYRYSDGVREQGPHGALPFSAIDLVGEYTLEEALDVVRVKQRMDYGGFEIVVDEGKLVLMTLYEYLQNQVEIHTYPTPSWAQSRDQQHRFAEAVGQLLGAKHDLRFTNIQVINGTIVVAAPPVVHAEIVSMAEQLKAISEQMQAGIAARQQQERHRIENQIARLRAEYEVAKRTYFVEREKAQSLETASKNLADRLSAIKLSVHLENEEQPAEDAARALADKAREAANQQDIVVREAKMRFERLQEILIDTEANLILADVDLTGF